MKTPEENKARSLEITDFVAQALVARKVRFDATQLEALSFYVERVKRLKEQSAKNPEFFINEAEYLLDAASNLFSQICEGIPCPESEWDKLFGLGFSDLLPDNG